MPIVAVHLSPHNFVEPERFWPERWEQQQQQQPSGETVAASSCPASMAAAEQAQHAQQAQQAQQDTDFSASAGSGGGGCPFGFGSGKPTPAGNSAALRQSFIPYALGPKDCIGQGLANAVGKAMLAALCSRFAFKLGRSMRSAEEVHAAEVIRLTLQPGAGVWLLPTPRA